jgi:tRNA G18 (ribose-2'-O)-methylase SpoU
MPHIRLIAHDIRSSHNVGSLLRTADGLGLEHVYLTGYTPFPPAADDQRLPHLQQKAGRDIHKTALGAEDSVPWSHQKLLPPLILQLQEEGYRIVALEQSEDAVTLSEFAAPRKLVLLIGREVEGIDPGYLKLVDQIVEIPMRGRKESFNVVQAAAMALYQFTHLPNLKK